MHLASFSKEIEPISKNITGFYTGNLDQFSIGRSERLMKWIQEELDKQIQELEKVKSSINAPIESDFA
jgi:rubrerythrin